MLKEAWTLAIETLSWMKMQNLSEHLALARTVKQLGISDNDAIRLSHSLVNETVRRQNFIDSFINAALQQTTIDEYNLGLQSFLQLFVYQTRMTGERERFDTKEAGNIVRMGRSILGWKTLQEVEPVLGVLLTQKLNVVFENMGDEERIGLLTFHPAWLVGYFFRLFGRPTTITMIEADKQRSPTYVRLNTLKASENEILQRLFEDGIGVEKEEQLTHTYRVATTEQPLTSAPSFKEGLFYIQDKASCFAVEAVNPRPKETVLEVCAAPGAKTTYLAQLMRNQGNIHSIDYSRRRMKAWKNEIARMGVEISEPTIADARQPLPFDLDADIVFLDPPCTSIGTFGKTPSAKWRLTPYSIDKMAEIQWQMLSNCAGNVKTKGTLIYSTCSITVEENEMLIERFLKQRLEFSLTEIMPKIGLPGLRGLDKCQRLYPHVHQCNGCFVAKMIKE